MKHKAPFSIFFCLIAVSTGCVSTTQKNTSATPPADTASLLQDTLENKVSGESGHTKISSDESLVITPLETWKSKSGHYCRSYSRQVFKGSTTVSSTRAVACRSDQGKWIKVS